MRIKCPYCGERALEEFTYRGDATVTRPDSLEQGARRLVDYVYFRDNPAGLHQEHWHHSAGCHAWLVVTRNIITHEIVAVEFAGEGGRDHELPAQPARQGRPDRPVEDRSLQLRRRAIHAAIRAIRWPRRCSPMACGWSAARSNITGRAASSPRGRRSRTRWSNCASGARREPNTPRDHHRTLRRARRGEPEPLAVAEIRRAGGEPDCSRRSSGRGSTTRPSCGRPPSGRSSTSRPSAAPRGSAAPPSAGPRPLREGQRVLRCAGDRRRAGGACGGARRRRGRARG